jgi:ABC-2 type transport system permease protein
VTGASAATIRAGRLVAVGWRHHVRNLTASRFFLVTTVFLPLLLASVAFLMFRAGTREGTLLYASLGAGVMGIWSSTLFGSGGAIAWARREGTLEVLVASPAGYFWVLLPQTVATATIGLYSLAATLLWGRLLFGVPFTVEHPLAFALAVPATVLALGMLGLLMASTFVLYRHANALSNMLEFPVLLASGLLVPLSELPDWVLPIAWLLAPTWAMRALRDAALGGHPWQALGMTLVLAATYLVAGGLFLRLFLRLSRERATLSLK